MGGRRQLLKSSSEWQTCAVQALEILTSPVLLEKASHKADDVIVATLPLVFVGRHGNQFSGQLANVLATSALSRDHPLLGSLQEVVSSQGVWEEGRRGGGRREKVCRSECEGRELEELHLHHMCKLQYFGFVHLTVSTLFLFSVADQLW